MVSKPLIKYPSAFIPILLSLAVLGVMLITIMISGTPQRETDEGTGAHLFQIWLILEVLMVGFFAVKWLPRRPNQALIVLFLQIAAVLAACAPVFLLHL